MGYYDLTLKIYQEKEVGTLSSETVFSAYCEGINNHPIMIIAPNEDIAAKGFMKSFNITPGKKFDIIRKNGIGFTYFVGLAVTTAGFDPCLIKGDLLLEDDDGDMTGVGDDDLD